ncbi:MAP kinase-activated protein kinase 5-like isoform X2 [Liolophura sinensis]|uniref:MAP kinase-activated protein kinase 5-like isoform X2 n=1 Tax=Liolophura sinensis TaxID=3198878 RepID=UPI003158ED2B
MDLERDRLRIKTNSILDDYDVFWHKKLGTGISGPVRLCIKKATREKFALKCLPDTPRSRTEVNLHVMCSGHPNIVEVYNVYANDVQFPKEQQPRARLLVVMELMQGGELFDKISHSKYFTEKLAAKYMHQIAHAVQRCHSLNIAHRDLKPENLLLKDSSEAAGIKLSDFGFAKIDDGNLKTPHFTPYYVAPEVLQAQSYQQQRRQGVIVTSKPYTYDKSCDMWSLGVILYIMLCGYPPFYSETPSRQITDVMKKKIISGEYEFSEDDWLSISPEAKDVVRRLLHVDPSMRLNIDDLLSHPWLNDAPDTALKSPAIISNKDGFEDIKLACSVQLTTLRVPDVSITLKPLPHVTNPIIRKRNLRRGHQSVDQSEEPPRKQSFDSCQVTTLRDIIAYCIRPPKADEDDTKLNDLVTRALHFNNESEVLSDKLTQWQWDGQKFNQKVDKNSFAESLRQLIQQISAHSVDSSKTS